MYRSCIFCSAALGANEAIERFPVGRSLAFDAARGRLWAVCPKCARWNLAPLEERWEAIEDAERLFRDSRLRAQSDNVGMAKLRDGTRLIRVGEALPGELAAWRYGREMQRRWRRGRLGQRLGAAGSVLALAGYAVSPFIALATVPVELWRGVYPEIRAYDRANRVAHRVAPADSPTGLPIHLRWRDLRLVRTGLGDAGQVELHVTQSREMWSPSSPVVLTGRPALTVLGKALAQINGQGAHPLDLDEAVRTLWDAGGAEPLLRRVAAREYGLEVPGLRYGGMLQTFAPSSPRMRAQAREESVRLPVPLRAGAAAALAMEMALHEETERRALEGELAMLEAMWREAEEIAAIADRLPELPAPEPPRLAPES